MSLVGTSGLQYYVSVLALNNQRAATVLTQPVITQLVPLTAFSHEQLAEMKVTELRVALRIGALGHHITFPDSGRP